MNRVGIFSFALIGKLVHCFGMIQELGRIIIIFSLEQDWCRSKWGSSLGSNIGSRSIAIDLVRWSWAGHIFWSWPRLVILNTISNLKDERGRTNCGKKFLYWHIFKISLVKIWLRCSKPGRNIHCLRHDTW